MSIEFVKILVGVLGGIWDIVQNIAGSDLADKINEKDFNALLENCLEKAVEQKSEFLNLFTSPQTPDGSKPAAYLDKSVLQNHLRNNPLIKPMTAQLPSATAWRPYLKPFTSIIVIPGCVLAESDQLDLIQGVLEVASQLFEQIVPHKHPAFEQLVLGYQRKHSLEHRQILEVVSTIPIRAAREFDQLRQTKEEPTSQRIETTAGNWLNPFSVVAADDLDLTNPEHVAQIRNLFIARHSGLPTIRKRFNTILEGQRGTGKTM